jgi:hypothetical protein
MIESDPLDIALELMVRAHFEKRPVRRSGGDMGRRDATGAREVGADGEVGMSASDIPETVRSAPDTRDELDVALACMARAAFEHDPIVEAIAFETARAIEQRRKAGQR